MGWNWIKYDRMGYNLVKFDEINRINWDKHR